MDDEVERFLGRVDDRGHAAHRLDRVLPDGSLAGERHCVGAVQAGIIIEGASIAKCA